MTLDVTFSIHAKLILTDRVLILKIRYVILRIVITHLAGLCCECLFQVTGQDDGRGGKTRGGEIKWLLLQ